MDIETLTDHIQGDAVIPIPIPSLEAIVQLSLAMSTYMAPAGLTMRKVRRRSAVVRSTHDA